MTNTKETATTMKSGYAAKRRTANIIIYVILSVMVLIWVFPIVWLVMQSFNTLDRVSTNLFPEGFTLKHYQTLFTDPNVPYGRWMLNTFLVALFSCIISTLFVLMVSYALSRLRFKSRKKLLNMGLILGMFPGFMSMAATYSIMEIFHLDGQLIALVIVYSSGAGLGYQVAKGFFDTIPRALDEAARIDGATSNRIFWVIILPLSKAGYGMYLIHMLVLAQFSGWFRSWLGLGSEGVLGAWTTPVQILSTALCSFVVVGLVAVLLQRIPRVGKYLMG